MTKDNGNQSPVESAIDDQYKSKRGRKPSQAKLAMLESKRLFADKRRFPESEAGDGNAKSKAKKKKPSNDTKSKNASSSTTNNFASNKMKKKKAVKVSILIFKCCFESALLTFTTICVAVHSYFFFLTLFGLTD